jgi:ribosomal subunit interface protein
MALRVSGKNLDIGETLRSQVEGRMAAALSKYSAPGYHGHVTVERDGGGFRTECVLHLDSGVTLEASGTAHDAYASFDQTAMRIEKRLRRYKRRLNGRPASAARSAYTVFESPPEDEVDGEAFHPVVMAETTRPLERLAVSEAVLELDLTGAPVMVFLHAGTGRVNVVYRRRDGQIGWIDPPPGAA